MKHPQTGMDTLLFWSSWMNCGSTNHCMSGRSRLRNGPCKSWISPLQFLSLFCTFPTPILLLIFHYDHNDHNTSSHNKNKYVKTQQGSKPRTGTTSSLLISRMLRGDSPLLTHLIDGHMFVIHNLKSLTHPEERAALDEFSVDVEAKTTTTLSTMDPPIRSLHRQGHTQKLSYHHGKIRHDKQIRCRSPKGEASF